jgi:BA14K-like protein
MADIQAHLKKIRSDAAECLVLSSLANDGKREVFIRIAEHLNALALELETSIKPGTGGGGASKHEEIAAFNVPQTDQQPAAQRRRKLLWLLAIVVGAISGALIWANSPTEIYWSFMQPKQEPRAQDTLDQAAVTLLFSGEQAERKSLSDRVTTLTDRVTTLTGRLDDIKSSLDNLQKTRAETAEPLSTGSANAEAKLPATEHVPPPPVEKPVSTAENRVSPAESPASLKPPDPVGPIGCTLFRSFDPKSGTYTTLDGRRRPCR